VAILLSSVASTQTGFVMLARICHALGTDKLLPRRFASVSHRFRTPVFGTVVVGLIHTVVIWLEKPW
jgi:amino acid transporter